jgi:uncharacterized protein YoxC
VVVLWVWVAVVVVALVVLGIIGYGLVGALTRLRREVEGAQRELQPVLEQLQATAAHAESVAARRANAG